MARLSFEDIAGGMKSTLAPPGNAEIIPEVAPAGGGGGFDLARANVWMDDLFSFLQKIDQAVGMFLPLVKRQGAQGQAPHPAQLLEVLPQDGPLDRPAADAAPAPAALSNGGNDMVKNNGTAKAAAQSQPAPQPSEEQIQKLMARIIEKEGDIPLSQLLRGIQNKEPWLIKHVLGMMSET